MPRQYGTPYKANAALTQFKRTMDREGKTCITYTGGTEFKCFFRIRDDNENQKEIIVIYFDTTSPVRPGTLICYGNSVFLALNRETVENDIYYKSTLVKCNGVYNDNRGYGAINVPFFADNIQSTISVGNNVITTLSGNIELITEDNPSSKKIDINDYFNEFDRTFKVSNKYIVDGIIHVTAEVTLNRVSNYNYKIVIDGIPETNVATNNSIRLSVTPYINGIATDAELEWSSSDPTVAAVDGTGLVSFIEEGTAEITVKWIEKDITASTGTITVGDLTEKWIMSITGNANQKPGITRTYTVSTTLDGIETYLENIQYEIINKSADIVFTTEIFDTSTNKLTLMIIDDHNKFIGNTYTIRSYHTEKKISATINVQVVGLY